MEDPKNGGMEMDDTKMGGGTRTKASQLRSRQPPPFPRVFLAPFLSTFLAVKTALYLGSSLTQRGNLGQGRAISCNSLNFQATSSRFCMVPNVDLPQKLDCKMASKKLRWPPKNKMAAKTKIVHNSLNFQARISRFCMVVHIDFLQVTHF